MVGFNEAEQMDELTGYKAGKFHFIYLGLPNNSMMDFVLG